jgi:hypothetical protein
MIGAGYRTVQTSHCPCTNNLFRRVRIVAKSARQLRQVRPSVCRLSAYISGAPTERIFVKFDIGDFCETLSRKSKFGQEWTKVSGTLHEDLLVFHIFGSDIRGATIQRTHCSASMTIFSIFVTLLTATCVRQQYKGNNGYVNAPQCYVTRTLHTLLGLMVVVQIIMRNVGIY